MREYKYLEQCPHCRKGIVIATVPALTYLPNVYKEEGKKRIEGIGFDLKKTVETIIDEKEIEELIEYLQYRLDVRLDRTRKR